MGIEYAKVLKALKRPFFVIGRGESSASIFEKAIGVPVIKGGVEQWLKDNNYRAPTTAIIAVDEENLGPITRVLVKVGVKELLVEKPGGINLKDLKDSQKIASKTGAGIFIAYNRRFYASVLKGKEFIKKDGGVTSFNFDFTELGYRIKKSKIPMTVKKEWLLANSSHVIDLAFFLGGQPERMTSYAAGGLDWHPSASIYVGSGISRSGALFSYHANWESAGRWGVEIMTPKRKLIFRPLERLQIQNIGSMTIEEVKIDDALDKKFKPGLYLQVKSFLGDKKNLPTIGEQVENLKYYRQINSKQNV